LGGGGVGGGSLALRLDIIYVMTIMLKSPSPNLFGLHRKLKLTKREKISTYSETFVIFCHIPIYQSSAYFSG
jgi:hypothetical protein